MYAVVETGSKQYRVAAGDTLEVELLEAPKGQEVTFDKVLLVADGDKIKVGQPTLAGAKVTADVVDDHKRCKKVIAFKMRRTEGYHRTIGHRQTLTVVKIKNIQA
ncbi:MAG: 50S ribosomal protein L21 [Verrucomicrobia bacterium]|nr:50S ribosomal protein L21 [Verrucomicrobiota bacterium]